MPDCYIIGVPVGREGSWQERQKYVRPDHTLDDLDYIVEPEGEVDQREAEPEESEEPEEPKEVVFVRD